MTDPTLTTHTGLCPLDCPDACSLTYEVEDGRVRTVDGNSSNPVTGGYICAKVRRLPEALYGPERVGHPVLRTGAKGEGGFRRVSWDEALDRIAGEFRRVRDEVGGEAILPFSYGGSNGFLSQDTTDARLFRRLGASRLARAVCAAPTGRATLGLYGNMAGVSYPDYVHARLIVVWGANPSASGIHLVPFIREAQKRGARLVVVDPRRTKLARHADRHLAVRPGTDLPLALALLRGLFAGGAADEEFLRSHASGAGVLRERAEPWTPARAAEVCGVEAGEIEAFAGEYASARPAVIRCGWGLERNRNGGSAAAAVLALPAVGGKFGVRGGGYTMSNSPAWGLRADTAAGEPEPGTRIINMNQLGRCLVGPLDPPLRALFVYNCNPLATMPNQEAVRRGLRREDLFTVVFDSFLTDTARHADVVLPAAAFPERRELARGYGAYALQHAERVVSPWQESRTNHEVFLDLVRRMGLERDDDLVTEDTVMETVLAGSPEGNEAREQLAARNVARPSFGESPVQFVDVFPGTSDGRVHLVPEVLEAEAPEGLYAWRADPATEAFPLALISPAIARTISSTLGQLHPQEMPLGIHPEDAEARGIADGDTVRVWNGLGEVVTTARVDAALRHGVVELPKGLWSHHTRNGATANALAPDTLADLGGGACFNDARVQVEGMNEEST
jgi:anaerobic selenocysteine-containing dehydrogenase